MRFKRSLHSLCDLHNALRAEKIEQYKARGRSLTKTGLRTLALKVRNGNAELRQVYSQSAQNVADRVHVGFKNYFEGRARFPRKKKHNDYRSMTYPQSGFKLEQGRLHLSKIGKVRIFLHRPIRGKIERLTIKYEAGEWYAIFLTEQELPKRPSMKQISTERVRGADLGLEKFAAFDNGKSEEYPQFLRRTEDKIKRLQRKLATKKRNSKRYRTIAFRLAQLHLHVKRQREDWQNKLVAQIFKDADVLVLEKLSVQGMLQNHCLAKSISDASWSKFARKATNKANLLRKHVIFVDPWGTTQFCHSCLHWVPKTLLDREHVCPNCGETLPRDVNSSNLIKRLGILSCSPSDGGLSLAEPKPLPSLRGLASLGVEAGSLRLKS